MIRRPHRFDPFLACVAPGRTLSVCVFVLVAALAVPVVTAALPPAVTADLNENAAVLASLDMTWESQRRPLRGERETLEALRVEESVRGFFFASELQRTRISGRLLVREVHTADDVSDWAWDGETKSTGYRATALAGGTRIPGSVSYTPAELVAQDDPAIWWSSESFAEAAGFFMAGSAGSLVAGREPASLVSALVGVGWEVDRVTTHTGDAGGGLVAVVVAGPPEATRTTLFFPGYSRTEFDLDPALNHAVVAARWHTPRGLALVYRNDDFMNVEGTALWLPRRSVAACEAREATPAANVEPNGPVTESGRSGYRSRVVAATALPFAS